MTEAVFQLKSQVDVLSTEERADLAYYLLESLDPDVEGDVETAWEAELSRRVAEIDNGTAKGRPADEVMAELRKQCP
jgi:putative addiction module component (TIGR02574 family)